MNRISTNYKRWRIAFLIGLATLVNFKLAGQDFDPLLEKNIKIEINMNREAKLLNRLVMSGAYKKTADSINMLLYRSYLKNHGFNSKGEFNIKEEEMWKPVRERWKLDDKVSYSSFVARHNDYKQIVKEGCLEGWLMFSNDRMICISAIRYKEELILTILLW